MKRVIFLDTLCEEFGFKKSCSATSAALNPLLLPELEVAQGWGHGKVSGLAQMRYYSFSAGPLLYHHDSLRTTRSSTLYSMSSSTW